MKKEQTMAEVEIDFDRDLNVDEDIFVEETWEDLILDEEDIAEELEENVEIPSIVFVDDDGDNLIVVVDNTYTAQSNQKQTGRGKKKQLGNLTCPNCSKNYKSENFFKVHVENCEDKGTYQYI